jgi:MFS family permease
MGIFSDTFQSLKNRNFRIYIFGVLCFFVSGQIYSTVTGWLMYRLTDSPVLVGAAGFAVNFPLLIFGLFAGVMADSVNRRKALIITQVLIAVLMALFGYMTVSGFIKPWQILVLGFMTGTIMSFVHPLRHSFVFELVGKTDLSNALSLNATIAHTGKIIGPAVAGLLITFVSEGPCYFINSVLIIIFALLLTLIKIKTADIPEKKENILKSIKSGVKYSWKNASLKYPLMLLASVSLVVMPFTILMPVATKQILGGDARILGILMSCLGAGALTGSVTIAARKAKKGLAAATAFATLWYGVSLTVFALSTNLYLSCLVLFLAGMGVSRQGIGVHMLLQTFVANNMRGRVLSLYMITFVGVAPFGSLVLGKVADIFGISATLIACGIWVVLCAFWFLSKISLMRINAYRALVKAKKTSGYENMEPVI